jgi:hypothetical protein
MGISRSDNGGWAAFLDAKLALSHPDDSEKPDFLLMFIKRVRNNPLSLLSEIH